MKFIDKLERKFGRFGIPNLTIYMIVCYVIGYALMIVNPGILNWLSLEPAYILRGQVWRLVTWVLYPPSTSGVLWFAIAVLFFYYPIGTSLERTIGTFKYTLYILSGVIFTILGAFILYFLLGGNVLVGNVFSTYYISLSTFLTYAMCYPDMQVLLFSEDAKVNEEPLPKPPTHYRRAGAQTQGGSGWKKIVCPCCGGEGCDCCDQTGYIWVPADAPTE